MIDESGSVAIAAQCFPPDIRAGAQVWRNLLGHLTPEDRRALRACVSRPRVSDASAPPIEVVGTVDEAASAWIERGWRWGLPEVNSAARVVRKVRAIAGGGRVRKLVLCFPSTGFFVGAYLAARRLRLPYAVYLHDLFLPSRRTVLERLAGRLFEHRILAGASHRFMLTEGVKAHYERTYGMACLRLPHTLPPGAGTRAFLPPPAGRDKIGLVGFCGNVHAICADAVFCLLRALRLLGVPKARLVVTGQLDAGRFAEFGDVVERRPFATRAELFAFQDSCDLLYNAVGFHTPYPEQARTCFPTKTLDYLCAARPTLCHAPEDTDFMRFVRETGCGLAVGSDEPATMAGEIRRLLADTAVQRSLVEQAHRAADRFDGAKAAAIFRTCLDAGAETPVRTA